MRRLPCGTALRCETSAKVRQVGGEQESSPTEMWEVNGGQRPSKTSRELLRGRQGSAGKPRHQAGTTHRMPPSEVSWQAYIANRIFSVFSVGSAALASSFALRSPSSRPIANFLNSVTE